MRLGGLRCLHSFCIPLTSKLLADNISIQVAASAGKDNVALASFAKVAVASAARETRKENISAHTSQNGFGDVPYNPIDSSDGVKSLNRIAHLEPQNKCPQAMVPIETTGNTATVDTTLADAVQALNLRDSMPSLVVNGSGVVSPNQKGDLAESFSEDPFQRTDSGSELGTKPPSLDGKSITSGTTFALDEKESLRPDDSASVKAAEDDDTFSGRGSIVAGSRIGSEAAARAYRAQFYEAPDRRSMQPMQERQNQGISTPQSGSSGQQTNDEIKPKALGGPAGAPDAFNLFYRKTPDEKLLEALESPKDRIFLLRLEQQVIEFVKDSK